MKVLLLSNMYPRLLGGIFIHHQAKSLLSMGCQVRVVVPVPYCPKIIGNNDSRNVYTKIPKTDTIDMVAVHYPRYIRLPLGKLYGLHCLIQYWGLKNFFRSIMEDFVPQIIHAHCATPSGFFGLMLKEKYNIPFICSLRGSDINIYPHFGSLSMHLTRRVISGTDRVVSVSHALKEAANRIASPKREILVIHNGCNLNLFHFNQAYHTEMRKQMGIDQTDKVLIFVGSISKDKGIFDLLSAFAILHKKYPNLRLIVIGDGPERQAFENLVQNSGLGRKVYAVGGRPHVEIVKYMNAADIFVLPSYFEGLPNVVLEAMACGLPVIVSNIGGIPDAVEDGKSGLLIRKGDVESLNSAIETLIMNDILLREMGRNGRKTIESKFTWQQNIVKTLTLYEDAINEKS